jgi:hypothetical protein
MMRTREQTWVTVKGKFLYSYFVGRVYVFRYPTEHSHPCKLTSKILALSVVERG